MWSPVTNQLIALFESKGSSMYGGELVTQLEHALQTAALAVKEQAPSSLIVASLLHDVGHLLHELPETATNDGIDDIHEALAAKLLGKYFIDGVVEPVKLHVQAKRFLCAVELGYYESLSRVSKASLSIQGGIMNDVEIENFQQNTFFRDAISLRKWDDMAKNPNQKSPHFSEYITYIEKSLK